MQQYMKENHIFLENVERTEEGFMRNPDADRLRTFSVEESKRIYAALRKVDIIFHDAEESLNDANCDRVLQ